MYPRGVPASCPKYNPWPGDSHVPGWPGNPRWLGFGWIWKIARVGRRPSCVPGVALGWGEAGTATCAATGQNLATCFGCHACAKTVPPLAFDIRRLECLFHLYLINPVVFSGEGLDKRSHTSSFSMIQSLSFFLKKGGNITNNSTTVKYDGDLIC